MSAENKKTEPSCSASKTKPERTKRASGTDFVREALASGDEAYTAFGEGVLGSREAATVIVKRIIEVCKTQLTDTWCEGLQDGASLMGLDLLTTPPRSHCANCGFEDDSSGSQQLRWCGRCFAVRYCSRDCQRVDWKAGHKQDCGPGKRLQSMAEFEYAAVRMFNDTFRLLIANLTPARYPLAFRYPERLKFRGWMCRVLCEKLGAITASESVDVLLEKVGRSKIIQFCVNPACFNLDCLRNRALFEAKGFSVQLGRSALEELKSKREQSKREKAKASS